MAYFKKTSAVERANILDSEVGLVLKTAEGTSALANSEGIIVKGTAFPSNDASIKGIVFEDVDMEGEAKKPISIIVAGRIIEANLPTALASGAKTAIAKSGVVLV